MTSTRTFYKTVFTIEVLSEDPIPETLSLTDIEYEITEGHCSGVIEAISEEVVDGPTMAQLLVKQGSAPEFFNIDDAGNDLDDEWSEAL